MTTLYKHPILQTWKIADGSVVNRIDLSKFGADFSNQVSFSPDDAILAITDGNLRLWDLATGKLIKTFKGERENSNVNDVIFTPDGAQVIYSTDNVVKIAKTSGEILYTLEPAYGPLCIFDDGKTLMTTGNGVQYWNVVDGKFIQHIPPSSYSHELYFSSGCDRFVMMSADGYFKVLKNSVDKLGEPVNVFDLRANGIYLIGPIAFSPNRELVAAQEAIGKIRIFNLTSGKTVSVLKGHMDWITSLNFTPDGKLLISGSSDGTIRLWGINP